jgi:hypothetical protein
LNANDDIRQISNAVFKTTVFEPGGNFSIDYSTGVFSPYKAYIGINIPKNTWGEPTIAEGKASTIQSIVL